MSKIIYIVTAGTYSDYHICAVFTDKSEAELYINAYGDLDNYIEEYTAGLPTNFPTFRITVYKNAPATTWARPADYPDDANKPINQIDEWGAAYEVYVQADNKDAAIKVASELIARHKAMKGIERP